MPVKIEYNPFEGILGSYYVECSVALDNREEVKKKHLDRIKRICKEESNKEVGNFLKKVIKALYADRKEQRQVIAQITMGAQPEVEELTEQTRLTVVYLLMNICRQYYGDEALSRL